MKIFFLPNENQINVYRIYRPSDLVTLYYDNINKVVNILKQVSTNVQSKYIRNKTNATIVCTYSS